MGTMTELPYSLHSRYASIAIAWTVIVIPPVFLNLGLFYGLWYGTGMDRMLGMFFSFAMISIAEIFARKLALLGCWAYKFCITID